MSYFCDKYSVELWLLKVHKFWNSAQIYESSLASTFAADFHFTQPYPARNRPVKLMPTWGHNRRNWIPKSKTRLLGYSQLPAGLYYRNLMMTSSNGNIFRVTKYLWRESTTGGFPSQRPVTRIFEFFFDLRLSKRLINQSRRRWCETPSHS